MVSVVLRGALLEADALKDPKRGWNVCGSDVENSTIGGVQDRSGLVEVKGW